MASRSLGGLLSLVRQGFEIEVDHGTRSIEAFLWIAETVESSVYRRGSLMRTPDGLRFVLDNPPLRSAAFSRLELALEGTPVPGGQVQLRRNGVGRWRTGSSVRPEAPLDFVAGDHLEVTVAGLVAAAPAPVTIRVTLETRAIPPPVWLEFREVPAPPDGA